jgi:hypothetical protein
MTTQAECKEQKEETTIVRADIASGNRMLVIQCLRAEQLPPHVRKQNPMLKQAEELKS